MQEERETTRGSIKQADIAEQKKYEMALIAACLTDVRHHARSAGI